MKGDRTYRSLPALAVAIALVLPAALMVLPGEAEAGTTRVLKINDANTDSTVSFKGFDANPTKLYDIDGDGDEEIIAQNDNQWVYVFDSKNGDLLFEVNVPLPPHWGARSFNGPEVSIMEKGGNTHLILASSAAILVSYRFDPGASSPGDFKFVKEWERRLTDCHDNPSMDAKPVLADLDKDGDFEILGAVEERGLIALNDDGTRYWKNCLGGGNAAPNVADLDQDGAMDVVHVSDGGVVAALNGQNGNWKWGFAILDHFNLGSAAIPVMAGIGQLDGNGGPDIVVGARDSHDANNFDNNHALLLALSSHGKILWSFQDPNGNPLTYTRPIIVDADNDGQNEVYWGDWNTMGHKPPPPDSGDAWAVTGPANFYRISANGHKEWRTTLGTWWSNKDLAVADVDGDGTQEVLANGPNGAHDGIWYLDSNNGNKETFVDVHPFKVQRAPVVADLYGWGTMQWVVQVAPNTNDAGGHGILVFDTGQSYDAAWPHLPDPKFGGSSSPSQPSQPSDPDGTFDATFRIHSPNEWWQQVEIRPDTQRTIQQVHVRLDGGAWHSMTHESYGHWTSSHHAPAGTQVEFRATDMNDQVSQSKPFTWLSGEKEKRSTSTSQSSFDPSYRVSDNVNEWWVEVYMETSDTVTSVKAKVNGGNWKSLGKTDWGSWAKSFHVPKGSEVVFQSTRSDGAQDTSQTFIWLSGGETSFSASFTPKAQGNDWWVETVVDANEGVASVDARINGGNWKALDKTDWGSWAKSIHTPDGSEVKFRATSHSGATAKSSTFVWH